jgi:hypothetical protein
MYPDSFILLSSVLLFNLGGKRGTEPDLYVLRILVYEIVFVLSSNVENQINSELLTPHWAIIDILNKVEVLSK